MTDAHMALITVSENPLKLSSIVKAPIHGTVIRINCSQRDLGFGGDGMPGRNLENYADQEGREAG